MTDAGGPTGPPFSLLAAAGWVALGGGIGAVGRLLVSVGAARLIGPGFPWGTAIVNLAGCLAIGVLAGWLDGRAAPALRAFLIVGVLGGFTTFSSFGLDTLALVRAERPGLALLNALGQTVLGVALVAAGAALGAWLRSR
jgi:CrcB protein